MMPRTSAHSMPVDCPLPVRPATSRRRDDSTQARSRQETGEGQSLGKRQARSWNGALFSHMTIWSRGFFHRLCTDSEAEVRGGDIGFTEALSSKSSARRPLPSGMGRKRRLLSRPCAPCGGWLLVMQRQPTASPPGGPFGGDGPLDNDMRRYFPRAHWLDPRPPV